MGQKISCVSYDKCCVCYKQTRHTLSCEHYCCKKCQAGISKYQSCDFINESKHLCPLCRIGKIPLNRNNYFHCKIMDTKTKYLRENYCTESDPKNADNENTYRFCKNCDEVFSAGNVSCTTDNSNLPTVCVNCSNNCRIARCPTCNVLIEWYSGCTHVKCTRCETHMCFRHQKTERQIKDELIKLHNEEPNSPLLKKIMKKSELNIFTPIGSGYYAYRCLECNKI